MEGWQTHNPHLPHGTLEAASARISALAGHPRRSLLLYALSTRQFGTDPFVELTNDVFLGHDHSTNVRRGTQSSLIEFAHLGVFGHHEVSEVHDVSPVERGVR